MVFYSNMKIIAFYFLWLKHASCVMIEYYELRMTFSIVPFKKIKAPAPCTLDVPDYERAAFSPFSTSQKTQAS